MGVPGPWRVLSIDMQQYPANLFSWGIPLITFTRFNMHAFKIFLQFVCDLTLVIIFKTHYSTFFVIFSLFWDNKKIWFTITKVVFEFVITVITVNIFHFLAILISSVQYLPTYIKLDIFRTCFELVNLNFNFSYFIVFPTSGRTYEAVACDFGASGFIVELYHKEIILYIECDKRGVWKTILRLLNTADQSVWTKSGRYNIIVLVRLSVHTEWSTVFNWRHRVRIPI